MTFAILILFAGPNKTILFVAVGPDRRSQAIVEQWGRVNSKTEMAERWKRQWKRQIDFVGSHYELRFVDSCSPKSLPSYKFGYGGRWSPLTGRSSLAIPAIAQIASNRCHKISNKQPASQQAPDMRWPTNGLNPVMAGKP